MRVAAAYEGEFVDWRGIAFDGSHGTHTSIKGEAIVISPDQPAWQNPKTKDWEDLRIIGREPCKPTSTRGGSLTRQALPRLPMHRVPVHPRTPRF